MAYDVCLDPGHGKSTAGKRSPDSTYFEYEFNRDVSWRIKAHLERCGLKVLLTVNDDSDPSLAQRCKIANNSGARIVASIHSNAAGDGWNKANYWMCGILAKGGSAEKLGKAIEAETQKLFSIKSNGVEARNWAMVRDTRAPAVLIEHGFHTNKDWLEGVLKTDIGRAKCAEADAKGICKYLGVAWKEEEPEMTQEQFNQMFEQAMIAYNVNTNAQPVDGWAKDAWQQAHAKEIFDGTMPKAPLTREQAAEVFRRMGFLK